MSLQVEPIVLAWFSDANFLGFINTEAAARGLGNAAITDVSYTDSGARLDQTTVIDTADDKYPIYRVEEMVARSPVFPCVVSTIASTEHALIDSGNFTADVAVKISCFYSITSDMDLGMVSATWADALRAAFHKFCKRNRSTMLDGIELVDMRRCTVDVEPTAWSDAPDGAVRGYASSVTGTVWVVYADD